ncbi:MAG: MFS transporter [Firmicutes bacterium]|nr:MFS transporter [Bacillota bacterium]
MKKKDKNPGGILSMKHTLFYSVGIFGVQLLIGFVNNFQTEFYNKMYSGFDPNIFYASAVIIFIAKLLSCVGDPIIGTLIDRSDSKKGKIRPWILRSAAPLALLTTLMFVFIPFSSKALLYAYITLTTVLWNIAMSLADIPSQGMLARLTPDVQERDRAASLSNVFKAVALAVPGVFITVVMLLLNAVKGAGNYPDRLYYLVTALALTAIGTGCYLLIYFRNREKVQDAPAPAISMGEMFRELKENKMILIVFLIYILGFARTMPLIVAVQGNGALIGQVNFLGMQLDTTADATWLPGLLGAVSGLAGVSLVPLINKKLGEKKTHIAFNVATFVFTAAVCVFYWSLPADSPLRYGNPALYMVMLVQFVSSFLFGTIAYIPLIMTADIVDRRQRETGQRREGVNFAILSMAIKLSNALCVMAGLLMVGLSGYTQVVYETGVIPVRTQNIAIFAYFGFAGVSALACVVPMLFYKKNA